MVATDTHEYSGFIVVKVAVVTYNLFGVNKHLQVLVHTHIVSDIFVHGSCITWCQVEYFHQ